MAGVAWVFVVAAAVATLVALLVFLVPIGRDGSRAFAGPRAVTGAAGRTGPAAASTPADSLARGFGYLQMPRRIGVRRSSVHTRLERAFDRIDAVDPHEAPRRVGEALLQASVAEADLRQPSTAPPRTRAPRFPAEHPRELE